MYKSSTYIMQLLLIHVESFRGGIMEIDTLIDMLLDYRKDSNKSDNKEIYKSYQQEYKRKEKKIYTFLCFRVDDNYIFPLNQHCNEYKILNIR